MLKLESGDMFPLVIIESDILPQAWELSVKEVYEKGIDINSEWNTKCREVTAIIKVKEPLKEPRIHLAGVLDFKSLFTYIKEILYGINDWRIGKDWHYTYHERLMSYEVDGRKIDQIDYIIEKLVQAPYSRRAIAITWMPHKDQFVDSPPCLQLIQCRVINGRLCMWVVFRSNDAFKAAFYNMLALTTLQKIIAKKLGVGVGSYTHIASSYHIYESDLKYVKHLVKLINEGKSHLKYWTIKQALKFYNDNDTELMKILLNV